MDSGVNPQALKQFEQFLSDSMGLDAYSVGHDRLVDVFNRLSERHKLDADTFFERLRTSPAFCNQVIDEITVPETWFMRGQEALDLLGRFAVDEWVSQHPDKHDRLRLLSVPCATGEEPYSLAMALAMRGFPMDRVSICAVDISCASIEAARAGVFHDYAFRGVKQGVIDRFFTRELNDTFRILPTLQRVVTFSTGNIIHDRFLSAEKAFDAIFCRNLLIYLNVASRQRVVQNLYDLLKPSGRLFVGASETGCFDERFEMIRKVKTFAFQRKARMVKKCEPSTLQPKVSHKARRERLRPVLPKERTILPIKTGGEPCVQDAREVQLTDVRMLADSGQFAEAEAHCDAYLQQCPMDADGFCLQGVIRGARGRVAAAEESFGRALYIAPRHEEALSHLILLLREQGKNEKAIIYEKRLISSR